MKEIALFCVSYQSDKERDAFLASINIAAKKASDRVNVEIYVANNTIDNNPGYFGAVKRLMQAIDVKTYDYIIISNVDLIVEEDFFLKLKAFYQFPILDTIYTRTFYRQKKYESHPAGKIYAGHGSLIILTNEYFKRCGKIDYPVFLFCEEIYLAEMCQKTGLSVEYVPTIKVTDSEHASTSRMKHNFYCRCNYEAIQYIIKTFY